MSIESEDQSDKGIRDVWSRHARLVMEGIRMGVIRKDKGMSGSMAWATTIEETR